MTTSPTSITLSWTLPALNGGTDITGYYIERCLEGGEDWVRCNATPFPSLEGQVSGTKADVTRPEVEHATLLNRSRNNKKMVAKNM